MTIDPRIKENLRRLLTIMTVMMSGRPWKFAVELDYYVEKSDTFGPEWMLSFNVTPVVKNVLASWLGLGEK